MVTELRFGQVVCNIIDRVIEASVFIVYEKDPLSMVFDEDVTGVQIVMTKSQFLFV